MSEGNSRPWQEILKDFLCFKEGGGEDCISQGKLSASSIQKYFELSFNNDAFLVS